MCGKISISKGGENRVTGNPGQIRNRLKIEIAEKESRDGKRYTYRDIHTITGIATSTLSDWVKGGVRLLAVDTLAALCAFLECTPGDLLKYVPPVEKKGKSK